MSEYVYEFTNQIALAELKQLFAHAGWTAQRTPETIQAMLDHTPVCLGVWDGERLIGFARAVTDDVYRAFVEDVIVDSDYRGQGVGAEMMRRLMERLAHVEEISLACADHLVPFYQRFGFERLDMTHMHIWRGG